MRKRLEKQRGDTLIEVLIAVAILSLATIMTITVVNRTHTTIIGEINREAVRSEVNSQSELIQYYHDVSERMTAGVSNGWINDDSRPYEVMVWDAIRSMAIDVPHGSASDTIQQQSDVCGRGADGKAFYLARGILSGTSTTAAFTEPSDDAPSIFTKSDALGARYYVLTEPGTNPLGSASYWSAIPGDGVWVNAVHRYTEDPTTHDKIDNDSNEYYDFYIKACWTGPDGSEEVFNLLTRINDSHVANNTLTPGGNVGSPTYVNKLHFTSTGSGNMTSSDFSGATITIYIGGDAGITLVRQGNHFEHPGHGLWPQNRYTDYEIENSYIVIKPINGDCYIYGGPLPNGASHYAQVSSGTFKYEVDLGEIGDGNRCPF